MKAKLKCQKLEASSAWSNNGGYTMWHGVYKCAGATAQVYLSRHILELSITQLSLLGVITGNLVRFTADLIFIFFYDRKTICYSDSITINTIYF